MKNPIALSVAFAFFAVIADRHAHAAETYTKETLPEACKKLVEGLKSCDAAGGSLGRACSKRVIEREGSKCPVSPEEAKRILGQ